MQLDLSTEFGARVARRLEGEHVAWLTTVRADGQPQPSPVWFLWDGDSIVIYSRPNQPKLRNIASNPKVALSFNSDADGGDVVVISAAAQHDQAAPRLDQVPAYLAKYTSAIAALDMTVPGFAEAYSAAIRLTPLSVRGF